MPKCKHGEMVPKTGFSQKTRRMWAAWMCKDKNPDCPPEWLTDSEVYAYWLEAVTGSGATKVIDADDDIPPF